MAAQRQLENLASVLPVPGMVTVMNKALFKSALTAMTLLTASAASAATVSISILDAHFENPTAVPASGGSGPLPSVTNGVTAPGSSLADGTQVSWGQGWKGGPQSNYVFDPRDVVFATDDSTPFEIGTFTHNNFAIYSDSYMLGTVDLSLTIKAVFQDDIGNAVETMLGATFTFGHSETPSFPSDPADCSTVMEIGPGSSKPRCSDQVTLLGATLDSFAGQVGDELVYLDLLGFGDNLKDLESYFWTTEGTDTSSPLFAAFSFERIQTNDLPPEPSPVPLPAGVWLMLAGIGSLAAARRVGKS